jgi:hypothetical protein
LRDGEVGHFASRDQVAAHARFSFGQRPLIRHGDDIAADRADFQLRVNRQARVGLQLDRLVDDGSEARRLDGHAVHAGVEVGNRVEARLGSRVFRRSVGGEVHGRHFRAVHQPALSVGDRAENRAFIILGMEGKRRGGEAKE